MERGNKDCERTWLPSALQCQQNKTKTELGEKRARWGGGRKSPSDTEPRWWEDDRVWTHKMVCEHTRQSVCPHITECEHTLHRVSTHDRVWAHVNRQESWSPEETSQCCKEFAPLTHTGCPPNPHLCAFTHNVRLKPKAGTYNLSLRSSRLSNKKEKKQSAGSLLYSVHMGGPVFFSSMGGGWHLCLFSFLESSTF